MIESVKQLIESVPVYRLAAESGIPVRNLYRWADADRLPGPDHVQEAHRQRIERAVKKLKRAKGTAQ